MGDFDPEEVAGDLRRAVVGRKLSSVVYERPVPEFKPVAPARIVIDTPEKENGTLFARVDLQANVAMPMLRPWSLPTGSSAVPRDSPTAS